MQVPQALEDAAWDAARAEVGDRPLANLASAIVDRSQRYTSDRDRLAKPADPTGDLAARATFFTVADAMKVSIPLAELANRGAIPDRPLKIVDVGAGCGAMTLGALATLPNKLDVLAIDRDERALRIAARAVRSYGGDRVTITTRTADAKKLEPADVILAGTVLNELPPDARLAVVANALAAIPDDGAVILIEPALRETSRALHELRDAMIARGFHVFAPCTRHVAPCPALADPRDWCHEDRAVELPARTRELAHRTGLRDSGLRFSYLVLRKAALSLVDVPAWRLVSAPMPEKGKLEIIGCGDAGRVTIRRLRRHRTDANRAFERADRGDVLVIDKTEVETSGSAGPRSDAEGHRGVSIDADTMVDRREPAKR